MRSTRVSSDLAVRARFASGGASCRRACLSRLISDSCRVASLARRSSSALRATRYCEYVPLYSMSSPSSRCRMRVIAWSSSARSWLIDEQRAAERAQERHQPLPWRRRRGGWSARRATAGRRRRTGCARARRAVAHHPTARGSGGRADRRRARARPRCAAPPTRPRSRRRSRTPPRRWRTRCTLRRRRILSTCDVQLLERGARPVEPAARQHVRERGASTPAPRGGGSCGR